MSLSSYDTARIMAENLNPEDQWRLAWRLIDMIGVVPIVSLSVQDIIDNRAELGLPEISREEIFGAMADVGQLDWSSVSEQALDEVAERLEEIAAENTP
jgi:hypothetical protein